MISQIGIAIFGGIAIFLLSRTDKWQRWGYIFGLISQPFWLYDAIKEQQWGIVALSI